MNRKLLLSATILLSAATAFGQPVLDMANTAPVVGESFATFKSSNPSGPGMGGEDATWDFSIVAGEDTTATDNYIGCSSSPDNCTTFPGANLIVTEPGNASYTYISSNSLQMSLLGIYFSDTDLVSYNDPQLLLQFPMQYTSTFTDNYESQYAESGFVVYTKGNVTVTADGWGTLITPTGTFNNVLRLHTVGSRKDSTSSGNFVTVTEIDNYSWHTPGIHTAIFSHNVDMTSSTGGNDTTTTSSYLNLAPTAIENIEANASEFDVFPNPATQQVTIRFQQQSSGNVQLTFTDITGKQIGVVSSKEFSAGKHEINYNTSALPRGLYFIKLQSGNNVSIKRIQLL